MKANKGITLIALVVTIIIMLILAGVTLNIALGDNGIFKMAQQAVEKSQEALEEEQRQWAMLEATLNEKLWYYTSEDKKNVPIPAGFAPTRIQDENTVKDGLVITDGDGNEFVWIPCVINENGDSIVYKEDPRFDEYQNTYSSFSWYDESNVEENKKSVNTYGGFYIARYEAGIPENANFYPSEKNNYKYYTSNVENGITKDTDKYKPVSKKQFPSWNYISYSNAKKVSENMYIENNSIKSQLIDSYAWETVANWIDKDNPGVVTNRDVSIGNYVRSKFKMNGIYAVHTYIYNKDTIKQIATKYEIGERLVGENITNEDSMRIEISTGSAENTKLKNIYDLAGNMFEYTTEIRSDNHNAPVKRGGRFDWTNDNLVFHWGGGINTNINVGFRVVLYLM